MILINDESHAYINATRGSRAIPFDMDPDLMSETSDKTDGCADDVDEAQSLESGCGDSE